jgi:inosine/xanthosine triphosphate pyrophosphatase family protein
MTAHFLFATRNRWKKRLFEPVFCSHGFKLVTLIDHPSLPAPPPESGATAIENALMKARHYHSKTYPWVFGDDAGLEINALNGEPGVRARHWNGVFDADVDDQTWLEYLLKRMASVPPGERTATFVAGWVLIAPDGKAYCREVRAPFEIAPQPIRPISPGSPITAVRLGPVDDLVRRQAEVRAEWEQWGIFEKLLRTEPNHDG